MASSLYSNKKDGETISLSESKEVKLWHERIGIVKKAKESWADESGATRFVQEYKGKFDIFFQSRLKKIRVPPINEVFSYAQSDMAATYNRDPYFTVNPKSGSVQGAKLREMRLNYWWRELQIKEELELEIIDKILVGSAWHKVGYAIDSMGTGENLKIESERLYSMRVDWKDVFWNLGSKRPPKDCLWMAQRIVRPLDEVKEKYPNAKGLEGVQNPDVDKSDYQKSLYKDDLKVAILYEIWNAKNKKIYLIAEGLTERFLEDPKPWPEHLDEFPFLMYWDFYNPDSCYPLSAISPWEAQILEEMILLAMAINHAKRWNRQAFANAGAFDNDALDKFERGDDGAMIVVNGKVGSDDLRFADYGQLPADFYVLMDRLQAIKRNTHGQPEFNRGGVTKTNTRTMGELNLMAEGARGREDRKIDRLETHLENIARHMDMELEANFDVEEVIKITGFAPEEVIQILGDRVDPVTGTVKVSPEDIKGEYDIEIKSGSTLPLNKENRQKIYESVLQTVGPIAGKAPMSPFLNALVQGILDGFDVKALEEAYQEERQLFAQQQAEKQGQQSVEQQKIAAETAKRGAQAQQVQVQTGIDNQDLQLGPVGRAQVEKLKKDGQRPSESISFKDLPERGQVQMARQAGILISEDEAPGIPTSSNSNGGTP